LGYRARGDPEQFGKRRSTSGQGDCGLRFHSCEFSTLNPGLQVR
jgi:hypothetical protein